MNRKVQLIINRHDNIERDIETTILQGFLLFLILFLIYISRVFDKALEARLLIQLLSFNYDLGFIVTSSSIKEFVKTLEEVVQVTLELEMVNVIIYDISKIEAIFFSKFN